jgi:GNAT superfamily N-acetyltransferase
MKTELAFIKFAEPADLMAIAALTNAAFSIEPFLGGERTSDANLEQLMQKGKFLLGYDAAKQFVASVYVELRGTRGYFGMLSIDPQRQGTGLGRAMVEMAEQYCRAKGCSAMDITVLSPRTELPPYYRKFGYVESGVEEFRTTRPLKDGLKCHLIVMSKTL